MDKVKDFLKSAQVYQFWILLALALVLPVWAWWSTTNQLMATTGTRVASINKSIAQIPKPGEKNPNENWIDEVKKSNEALEAGLKDAWEYLYKRQQQFKKWPKELIDRGFIASDPDKAKDQDLQRYNIAYPKEVDDVWKVVNTIDGKPMEMNGPVFFPRERMHQAAWSKGVSLMPTIEQMKGAQEDLWLMDSLLRSIRRVNGSAKTPLKAAVREIQAIVLRGGSLAALGGAPAAPAAEGEGGGGGMRGRGGEEGGGGTAAPPTGVNADFDPGEEMGPDLEKGGGVVRGGGEDRGMGEPAAAAPAASKRYLEELPQARKRGFYLQVVIEQNKLPELLAQLSNSEWPVRILHVNMAERNPDTLVPPADENLSPATRLALLKRAPPEEGLAPRPGMGVPGAGPAPADEGRAAAMADPYLAVAAVSGYIVIYNPPPAPPEQEGQQSGGTPTAPANGQQPAVSAPGAVPNPVVPQAGDGKAAPPTTPASSTDSKTGVPAKSSPAPTGPAPALTPPAAAKGPGSPPATPASPTSDPAAAKTSSPPAKK